MTWMIVYWYDSWLINLYHVSCNWRQYLSDMNKHTKWSILIQWHFRWTLEAVDRVCSNGNHSWNRNPQHRTLHRSITSHQHPRTGMYNPIGVLQPTSNSVEPCRNYEYVTYVLSLKFKRWNVTVSFFGGLQMGHSTFKSSKQVVLLWQDL